MKIRKLGAGLIIISLLMSGCSSINKSSNIDEMQKTESNNEISKEYLKITDYFMLLQVPYDPVLEGCLSEEEKQELLNKRILKPKSCQEVTIKINRLSDKEIEIQGEGLADNYSSQIKLFSHENGGTLVGKEISFAQRNLIELFTFDPQNKKLVLVASTSDGEEGLGILPKFNVNDFLSADNALPSTDGTPIIYYFESENTIGVEPYTWMQEEFENRTIEYTIYLKWNGEKFEIIKEAATNS